MIAVCANSGLADTTPVKTITIIKNYATIPYKTSFEKWTTHCATAPYGEDAPDNFWVTNPASGNASVRRDDAPMSVSNWIDIRSGQYVPYASDSLSSARFHSARVPRDGKGTFDLLVNLNTPSIKTLAFDHLCSSTEDSLHVWLSEDGGVTFSTLLGSYSQTWTTWESHNISLTSNSATCIIRFLFISGHSGEDMGIDNLSIAAVCSARPTAGIISTPSVSCPNTNQIFTTTGTSIGLGIIYQWQKSINETTWANIAGATTTTLTDTLRVKSYYRMLTICTRVSLADTTPVATVDVSTTIFARLPYATSFENEWATRCITQSP